MLPRLELRIERLQTTFRFTWAFHAREVRFERDTGSGFERLFPETFSFHARRHDPAELYLQLEDLWSNPRLLGPSASRRESEHLVTRLLAVSALYFESILDRLEAEGEASPAAARAAEDAAVFARLALRFLEEHDLGGATRLRLAGFQLRKLSLRALRAVVEARVRPEHLEAWVAGSVEGEPASPYDDVGFFYCLAGDDPERIDRSVLAAAEGAFYEWLEGVCLDVENGAFETEGSGFDEREQEVLRAITVPGAEEPARARDLVAFLRRPGHRDCQRVLEQLETFFLRRYDVRHAAALHHHASNLQHGTGDPDSVLTWHSRASYLAVLAIPTLPFLAAAFAYERAPFFFDVLVSVDVSIVTAGALWFLGWRFLWRRDISQFRAAVPRIAAGIIVGYLPVFLIDEVWDLAEQPLLPLSTVVFLLGTTTLLYLHLEVVRRLGETPQAFRRALDIFLLGLNQSAVFGLVVTTLLGPLMALRNWGVAPASSMAELRAGMEPFVAQLPRVVGIEPFLGFPTAVLLMSVLAFFIGTFLQLLWEDLPITEPL